MKDPIVAEIHRTRAKYARQFQHDIHAIGEDIRRREGESRGQLLKWDAKRKQFVRIKKVPLTMRRRAVLSE